MAGKNLLTTSEEAAKLAKNLNDVKNDVGGDNSSVVYNRIIEDETARVQKLAEEFGVRAYNGINTLAKRFEKINKPDKTKVNRPSEDSLEFTQKPTYSVERANEITMVAAFHGDLVKAFDTAMSKGSEKNWITVGELLKNIKKKLGNEFEK